MMVATIQASALALKRPCYRITSTTTVTTPREVTSQGRRRRRTSDTIRHHTGIALSSEIHHTLEFQLVSPPPFLVLLEYGGGTQVTIKVAIDR